MPRRSWCAAPAPPPRPGITAPPLCTNPEACVLSRLLGIPRACRAHNAIVTMRNHQSGHPFHNKADDLYDGYLAVMEERRRTRYVAEALTGGSCLSTRQLSGGARCRKVFS